MINFRSNSGESLSLRLVRSIFVCIATLVCVFSIALCDADEPASAVLFQDVTAAKKLAFQHHSPLTVKRHLHLMMGSGVGWIDFDHDGYPDLFCAQGEEWHGVRKKRTDETDLSLSNRLFQNREGNEFRDITAQAGLVSFEYAMGVAVGDFNHDGFDDLYVSQFGRNLLYCNNGDGTFTNLSAFAHVDDPGYGASCTWADLDGDGLLDLYVTNYLEIDREQYPICSRKVDGARVFFICHPRYVRGEYDVVYRNLGNGRFLNMSKAAGLHSEPARQGLGVFAADFDDDGDIDIYVANDSVANQLWVNDGKGNFTDQALISGLAFNRAGEREAGMGLAGADYNADAKLDLFVTNYFGETNTLYRNEGALFFLDVTDETGLATPSRVRLGFGASFLDANNDSWEDLFVTNGHVHDRLSQLGKNEPYEQEPQLFLNRQGNRFEDISPQAGDFFQQKQVGRGSAVADFNRDGKADIVVSHLNEKLVLLENQSQTRNQSLSLELIGTKSNRSALGAIVQMNSGANPIVRLRKGSSSYLSADEGRLLVGLGEKAELVTVKVIWQGGNIGIWSGLQPGGHYTLIEEQSDSANQTPSPR